MELNWNYLVWFSCPYEYFISGGVDTDWFVTIFCISVDDMDVFGVRDFGIKYFGGNGAWWRVNDDGWITYDKVLCFVFYGIQVNGGECTFVGIYLFCWDVFYVGYFGVG